MDFANSIKAFGGYVLENYRYHTVDKAAHEYIRVNNYPQLTKQEKADIDDYWSQFHIKFRDYNWHRLYYAVTGKHDPRFIPQPFAERILYQYYNDQKFAFAYEDKGMFSAFLPNICFPDMIGKRVNGGFYDSNNRYYGEKPQKEYIDKLYGAFSALDRKHSNSIIIKETIDTKQGRGVRKYRIYGKADLEETLNSIKLKDYIIQTVLQQHPFFEQFNKDSVNIIRLTTWRHEGIVDILAPCIRFGVPGYSTDVTYQDGVEIINAIGIDSNGHIFNDYMTLDGKRHSFPKPVQRSVPQWDSIVRTVTANAFCLPRFGIIGWDIVVDHDDQVVCIEYNVKYPGTIVYQFIHGPLAGDKTDKLLAFLQDKENLCYIPGIIRGR